VVLVTIYSYCAKAGVVIIQAAAGSDEAVECDESRPDCNQFLPTPAATDCFHPKHIQYLVLSSLLSQEMKGYRYRIHCESCDGLLQAARQLLLSSHPRLPSPALPMRHRSTKAGYPHRAMLCFSSTLSSNSISERRAQFSASTSSHRRPPSIPRKLFARTRE